MKDFSNLLNQLYYTHSNLEKMALLKNYFATASYSSRGYALSIIVGTLKFKILKRGLLKELINTRIDPFLAKLSRDYVGDLSESVALLWPENASSNQVLPSLEEIISKFQHSNKDEIMTYLNFLMDNMNSDDRWALLKIVTGSLRIGVSARFIKQALAEYGGKTVHEIEQIWHATSPPYIELFAWLEGNGETIQLGNKAFFHPVMLSQPLDEDKLYKLIIEDFFVEWKYDGIRVQIVITSADKALYSRTGDDITQSFPDAILIQAPPVVLDGELVIKYEDTIGSFNHLQKRLNKKKPSDKFIRDSPAHIILYDILSLDGNDVTHLALVERRRILQGWVKKNPVSFVSLSEILPCETLEQLIHLRETSFTHPHPAIEGVMIKRKSSSYIAGRPSHQWYKWKRDPLLIDAVLMYAQLGHGKRSSFYSDYTFGLWQQEKLLPAGKAYFGFTDEELKNIDKWIRSHTLNKFGPVREVQKGLVFEIAFEGVQASSRHKSGYSLRFPRINRIRWDKPANEADHLEVLEKLLKNVKSGR